MPPHLFYSLNIRLNIRIRSRLKFYISYPLSVRIFGEYSPYLSVHPPAPREPPQSRELNTRTVPDWPDRARALPTQGRSPRIRIRAVQLRYGTRNPKARPFRLSARGGSRHNPQRGPRRPTGFHRPTGHSEGCPTSQQVDDPVWKNLSITAGRAATLRRGIRQRIVKYSQQY